MNNPLGQFSPATIWVGSHYWVIFHLRAMFARVKTRVRHVFLGNGGRVTEQVIVPTTGVPIFFYNSIKKRRQSMTRGTMRFWVAKFCGLVQDAHAQKIWHQ